MADTYREAKDDPAAASFIDDLLAVCRKHGLSLAHEDGGGSFLVDLPSEANAEWLRQAYLGPGLLKDRLRGKRKAWVEEREE